MEKLYQEALRRLLRAYFAVIEVADALSQTEDEYGDESVFNEISDEMEYFLGAVESLMVRKGFDAHGWQEDPDTEIL